MGRSPACPDAEAPALRIALVHTADQGGGAEASTLSLHVALRQLGHDCRLLVGRKETDVPGVEQIERFRCFPGVLRAAQFFENRFGWQYIYQPWFRRLDRLLGEDIDVVHYHSLWSGRLGYADVSALPRLTRRYPSVMTLRDWWMFTGHCARPAIDCERWKTGCGQCPDLSLAPAIDVDGTHFNWRRKLRAIQRSDLRITTVSNWLAGQIRESPIFAGKEVATVYNGIDETQFFPRPRAELRRKLGLPAEAFIVMLAGQSVEGLASRGNGAVEYALGGLAASGVEPFALLVGKSAPEVLAMWGRPGVAAPFQTDPARLAEYYGAADVAVAASLWETFGRVPAEAQMCGIPVAAFETGGIPEVVEHESTGLIVPRCDAPALGRAIARLHASPELRKQMGERGAERARRLFGNQSVARAYVQHYREVIARRRGGGAPCPGATGAARTAPSSAATDGKGRSASPFAVDGHSTTPAAGDRSPVSSALPSSG